MTLRLAPLLSLLALTLPAAALDVPRPSPSAKVMQTVGLTEITVDYSSPAVRGRQIWGALEPWGEVWRAGANATTKITFSRDVTIGGALIPAGSYAFFVIPKQSGPWTVIINKDWQQGGAFHYSQALDLVRVDVAPEAVANHERLSYGFASFDDDGGVLELTWEKVRLAVPFRVDTEGEIAASVKALEDGAWEPYNAAASYERSRQRWEAGLAYADRSIKLRETWQNLWTRAQLEAGKGNTKAAIASAERARALGGKDEPQFFQDDSAKALAEWKARR